MLTLGTDPTKYDSDDDYLSDGFEVELRTSPLIADSDGDGFNDLLEVVGSAYNDPTVFDPIMEASLGRRLFSIDLMIEAKKHIVKGWEYWLRTLCLRCSNAPPPPPF